MCHSQKQLATVVSGEGIGYSSTGGCSGGGHGGGGGQGQSQPLSGKAHGSYANPASFGYNGGHSLFPHVGGVGGGRLHIDVSDCFTIDGSVSANGGDWRSPQAGGGSAGSIFIHTRTLDGAGVIEASGGKGYDGPLTSHGGGGSGGRVALYYKVNNYVGELMG